MRVTFPENWWRGRPLILGHRGASRAAPENTLAAFREAARMGADGVELDVHLSADGVPVVIHNASVNVTTDGKGYVHTMPLAQLKELDAGSHFAPRFAGERIPTLEEVFAEVGRQLLINIELKSQPAHVRGLEPAVVDLVNRMGMAARVWVSSFKPYMLSEVRRLAPQIPCGLLYEPASVGVFLLSPFTPYEAVHPHYTLATAGRVRRAHRRQRRVMAWTVDNVSVAQALAALGVDGLITNTPDRLLAAMA